MKFSRTAPSLRSLSDNIKTILAAANDDPDHTPNKLRKKRTQPQPQQPQTEVQPQTLSQSQQGHSDAAVSQTLLAMKNKEGSKGKQRRRMGIERLLRGVKSRLRSGLSKKDKRAEADNEVENQAPVFTPDLSSPSNTATKTPTNTAPPLTTPTPTATPTASDTTTTNTTTNTTSDTTTINNTNAPPGQHSATSLPFLPPIDETSDARPFSQSSEDIPISSARAMSLMPAGPGAGIRVHAPVVGSAVGREVAPLLAVEGSGFSGTSYATEVGRDGRNPPRCAEVSTHISVKDVDVSVSTTSQESLDRLTEACLSVPLPPSLADLPEEMDEDSDTGSVIHMSLSPPPRTPGGHDQNHDHDHFINHNDDSRARPGAGHALSPIKEASPLRPLLPQSAIPTKATEDERHKVCFEDAVLEEVRRDLPVLRIGEEDSEAGTEGEEDEVEKEEGEEDVKDEEKQQEEKKGERTAWTPPPSPRPLEASNAEPQTPQRPIPRPENPTPERGRLEVLVPETPMPKRVVTYGTHPATQESSSTSREDVETDCSRDPCAVIKVEVEGAETRVLVLSEQLADTIKAAGASCAAYRTAEERAAYDLARLLNEESFLSVSMTQLEYEVSALNRQLQWAMPFEHAFQLAQQRERAQREFDGLRERKGEVVTSQMAIRGRVEELKDEERRLEHQIVSRLGLALEFYEELREESLRDAGAGGDHSYATVKEHHGAENVVVDRGVEGYAEPVVPAIKQDGPSPPVICNGTRELCPKSPTKAYYRQPYVSVEEAAIEQPTGRKAEEMDGNCSLLDEQPAGEQTKSDTDICCDLNSENPESATISDRNACDAGRPSSECNLEWVNWDMLPQKKAKLPSSACGVDESDETKSMHNFSGAEEGRAGLRHVQSSSGLEAGQTETFADAGTVTTQEDADVEKSHEVGHEEQNLEPPPETSAHSYYSVSEAQSPEHHAREILADYTAKKEAYMWALSDFNNEKEIAKKEKLRARLSETEKAFYQARSAMLDAGLGENVNPTDGNGKLEESQGDQKLQNRPKRQPRRRRKANSGPLRPLNTLQRSKGSMDLR
ncbi:hypothetical protein M8818_007023 [Zalaria obscura]|uniref:Uncharacterized protein n=1 Tax=Zalaria obscura TaxID=2024903 RepID=A0ACC3S437_9PEZI